MILVTGATGTVGSAVIEALKGSGVPFRAGVRDRKPEGVESVSLDFEKRETLRPALKGIESLFLLSNLVAPELNVVEAAKAEGVKRIVKLSVWRCPDEAYTFARWHRPVERAIEASGLAYTFLRCNIFMQNMVTYMSASIRNESAFYAPAAQARMAHVDARDIAAVAAKALTSSAHDFKAYNVSGPESLSFGDVAKTLGKVSGREIRYVEITPEDYKKASLGAGAPETYVDALLDLYRYYREGKAAETTDTVRSVTGREPVTFERFARDHASAWKKA
jgi:uncharacterized protein YbjT (DUF2867 family)